MSTIAPTPAPTGADTATTAPRFKLDPNWPLPLPNRWLLGQVSGVATDADDHVWVLQRPASLTHDERGIHVDPQGFVWITSNGPEDGQLLKFTRDGRFVMQIGKVGPQTGSADLTRLGQAVGAEVDAAAHEVYVADGYFNRRVIVFDSDTGACKRHWGAYGKAPVNYEKPNVRHSAPPTAAQREHFGNPVHCVRLARDGLVYVCNRLNDRVQVFRKDSSYVKEFAVEPQAASNGSVWDLLISRDPEQRWLFLAEGRNVQVLTLWRGTGEAQATLGRPGRYAGECHCSHDMAIDSHGDLYAGKVDTGKRVQRFVRLP